MHSTFAAILVRTRTSLLALALSGACVGCSFPTITATAHPTTPQVRTTSAPVASANRRIFVLSPVSLEQVSGGLTGETTAAESRAGATATGVMQTTDYNVATSAFERALLNGGFQPVSQAALTSAMSQPEIASRVRDLSATQGANFTLLQLAMTVGPHVDASLALLVRSVQARYLDSAVATFPARGTCRIARVVPAEVTLDTVLVNTGTGDVVWTGEARMKSSDLLTGPVEFPYGPDRSMYTIRFEDEVITGANDGDLCGFNIIGEFFCAEFGQASGGCQREQAVPPRVVQRLAEAAIEQLTQGLSQVIATSGT